MDRMPKALIRRIGAKVNEIKVGTMGITTERVIIFEMETATAITSTVVNMVTETIRVGPKFQLKIWKLLLGMGEEVWRKLGTYCKR